MRQITRKFLEAMIELLKDNGPFPALLAWLIVFSVSLLFILV